MEMKYTRISVVNLLTAWIYSTGTACRLWSNKPDYNGLRSPTFVAEYDVQSLLVCGIHCRQSPSCMAFIYLQQTCQLLSGFLFSMSGLQTSENAIYYEDDQAGKFRTDALANSSLFTYNIVRRNANFTEAVTACTAIGAHLVRLSTTKHEHLVTMIQSSSDYSNMNMWVDGSNVDATNVTDINEWVFTNGEPMPIELWTGVYPDSIGRCCAQLWYYISWSIDDTWCFELKWFICEK